MLEIMSAKMSAIMTLTQSAYTCSKLTIKTLEQGVKYVHFEHVNADWVRKGTTLTKSLKRSFS